MTPERKARLEAAGIDVDALSERVMGSEALMERLLGKFAASRDYPALAAALEEGGRERACAAAHTLKGVCGNLSMTALFDLLTHQVAAFRAGDWEGAVALLEQIDQAYARVTAAIREACA